MLPAWLRLTTAGPKGLVPVHRGKSKYPDKNRERPAHDVFLPVWRSPLLGHLGSWAAGHRLAIVKAAARSRVKPRAPL